MTDLVMEFKISQRYSNGRCITKIENNTIYDCIFQLLPESPKRKKTDCLLIKSNTFHVLEQLELDLCRLGIIFKND